MAAAQASLVAAGSDARQAGVAAAAQVQYLVSDGYADGGLVATLEYAKGQVLDRECATGAIGRGYPALPLRIMCSIHGCIYRMGLPVKCFLSACHTWKYSRCRHSVSSAKRVG